tara:strand:+ start:784 stop:1041 length:258 start_codon:yes stop_codon:yes gene_type:complete
MKVKEVIEMLQRIPEQDAILDISCDPEGNQYGPVDEGLSEGYLKENTKQKVYTLYPSFLVDALDRYTERDAVENYSGNLEDLFYG